MGLWTLFVKGGWLMWPLLALGGVTIFIFVERFMAIRKASVLDMKDVYKRQIQKGYLMLWISIATKIRFRKNNVLFWTMKKRKSKPFP